jgi:hypothetical protein
MILPAELQGSDVRESCLRTCVSCAYIQARLPAPRAPFTLTLVPALPNANAKLASSLTNQAGNATAALQTPTAREALRSTGVPKIRTPLRAAPKFHTANAILVTQVLTMAPAMHARRASTR